MLLITLLLLQTAPPVAPWTPRERSDAATGTKSVTAGVTSRERNARLALRCDAQVPVVSLQYIPREALGAGPDRVVSLSFDGGAPMEFGWEFPGTAAFVRDTPQVVALTTALARAKTIKVHTMSVANAAVDATFDGPASDAPVKAVLAACGYTLGEVPIQKDGAAK